MAKPWIVRDGPSFLRAMALRWKTRGGFQISDEPAFAPETTAWFHNRLKTLETYIEFGSGASTLLAARAGIKTLSMESDPRFAAAVEAALPPASSAHVLRADLGLTEYWGYPVCTRQTPERIARWANYVNAPLALAKSQGWTPDLVLVDGRFRAACALVAARTAQTEGRTIEILFDDYLNRPYYKFIEDYLGPPQIIANAALFIADPNEMTAKREVSDSLIAAAVTDFR